MPGTGPARRSTMTGTVSRTVHPPATAIPAAWRSKMSPRSAATSPGRRSITIQPYAALSSRHDLAAWSPTDPAVSTPCLPPAPALDQRLGDVDNSRLGQSAREWWHGPDRVRKIASIQKRTPEQWRFLALGDATGVVRDGTTPGIGRGRGGLGASGVAKSIVQRASRDRAAGSCVAIGGRRARSRCHRGRPGRRRRRRSGDRPRIRSGRRRFSTLSPRFGGPRRAREGARWSASTRSRARSGAA